MYFTTYLQDSRLSNGSHLLYIWCHPLSTQTYLIQQHFGLKKILFSQIYYRSLYVDCCWVKFYLAKKIVDINYREYLKLENKTLLVHSQEYKTAWVCNNIYLRPLGYSALLLLLQQWKPWPAFLKEEGFGELWVRFLKLWLKGVLKVTFLKSRLFANVL